MIKVIDVINALKTEFKKCVPDSNHCYGKIPETYKSPTFAYFLVYNSDLRSSYFRKDTTLDLQIVYFGTNDAYGVPDYEEKLQVMDKLKVFLNTFNLWVGDRNLKFEYNFSEADEQLAINIKFKFKDDIINTEFDNDQAMDIAEVVYMNDKEVI